MLHSSRVGWMQQELEDVDEVGQICQQFPHSKLRKSGQRGQQFIELWVSVAEKTFWTA